MKKSVFWTIAAAALFLAAFLFFRFSPGVTELLWKASNNGTWFLPLVLVAAVIDSVNPCAFSILLLTIAFLLSIGQARREIMKIGGVYIFGLFAVYVSIGLGILQVLHIFNTPHFMAKAGGVLVIILGAINLINEFFPSFPIKLKIPNAVHRPMAGLMHKASLPTAFGLGVLVGLCEFPCTGGPYLMVLGLLHDQKTYFSGLGYLLLYNVIFVLPLIIILAAAANKMLLQKVETWKKENTGAMRLYGGILMIALGLLIFAL